MSFVNPGVFLSLIPLAGIVLLLYLLKMKRRDVNVPASFLWPNRVYEVRANSLFQRLRFTLLLFLQLLALTLLVFAFARPQVRESALSRGETVIVIDASAGMASTDVSPSRIGQAIVDAEKFVDAARPGDRLSVIEAGPVPRVVFPLSDDPGRMRAALRTIHTYDTDSDVGEALRLAASLVEKASSATIVLLSDGDFADVKDFAPGRAHVVFQRIGTSGQNAAITSLGAADTPTGPQLYCGLKNYGAKPQAGSLNIYADGELLNSLRLVIPAKGVLGKTMPLPTGAKVIEAKLDDGDYLQSDNYAAAVRGGQAISVLLVGPGDIFLERALSIDPRVTVYKAAAVPDHAKYDLVVFDGVPETSVEAEGVLDFGSVGAGSPVRVLGTAKSPRFRDQSESDPLLKGVDLSNLFIDHAQSTQLTTGSRALASLDCGPLIAESGLSIKHVYVAFSPLDSDWPMKVSFPIFIGNAISILAPRQANSGAFQIDAGRIIAFPAESGSVQLTSPNGDNTSLSPTRGEYVLAQLDRVGQYRLETNPPRTLYVTMNSETQSAILPRDRLILGGSAAFSSDSGLRLNDWWRPVALLALLTLFIEWWVFMRRS